MKSLGYSPVSRFPPIFRNESWCTVPDLWISSSEASRTRNLVGGGAGMDDEGGDSGTAGGRPPEATTSLRARTPSCARAQAQASVMGAPKERRTAARLRQSAASRLHTRRRQSSRRRSCWLGPDMAGLSVAVVVMPPPTAPVEIHSLEKILNSGAVYESSAVVVVVVDGFVCCWPFSSARAVFLSFSS